jgi:hypothetical protein
MTATTNPDLTRVPLSDAERIACGDRAYDLRLESDVDPSALAMLREAEDEGWMYAGDRDAARALGVTLDGDE